MNITPTRKVNVGALAGAIVSVIAWGGGQLGHPIPGEVGSEWSSVSTGIMPIVDGAGTTEPVFSAQGTRGLAIGFTADGDSGPASLFVTAATGRGPQSNASPQCF